jgi:hypothetical protein
MRKNTIKNLIKDHSQINNQQVIDLDLVSDNDENTHAYTIFLRQNARIEKLRQQHTKLKNNANKRYPTKSIEEVEARIS